MNKATKRAEEGAILSLRSIARPLIFRSGNGLYDVGTVGTGFLVAHGQKVFVVTATHLVSEQHQASVHVLPNDRSLKSLRLNRRYEMRDGDSDEAIDIVAFEVDHGSLPGRDRKTTRLLNLLNFPTEAWKEIRYVCKFFVFGHPRDMNSVDYDARIVLTNQAMMVGEYAGIAYGDRSLHELRVENLHGLETYAGLSGSPVFATMDKIGMAPETFFAGMAVSGGPESGLIRFLEAGEIMALLAVANDPLNHL